MKSPQDNASLCVKTRLPEATCRQRKKSGDTERKGWGTEFSDNSVLLSGEPVTNEND